MRIVLVIYDGRTKLELILSFVNWFNLSFLEASNFDQRDKFQSKKKIIFYILKIFYVDSFIFSNYLIDLLDTNEYKTLEFC